MQAGLTLEADIIGMSANLRHTSLLVKLYRICSNFVEIFSNHLLYKAWIRHWSGRRKVCPGSGVGVKVINIYRGRITRGRVGVRNSNDIRRHHSVKGVGEAAGERVAVALQRQQ